MAHYTDNPEPTRRHAAAPRLVMKVAEKTLRAMVIALVVQQRRKHGLGGLTPNQALTNAAQDHADDMSAHDYFQHDSRDGTRWDQRIVKHGFHGHTMGENIAYGQLNPAGVVKDWMNSPPHRHNILTADFTMIGIGYAADGRYWVQDFGGK